MDGDDYTYDLRTCETKQADRITALEKRVDELSAIIYGSGIHAPAQLPYGRAGVLITRNGGTVHAQHIVVHHTPLLDADEGIRAADRQRGIRRCDGCWYCARCVGCQR